MSVLEQELRDRIALGLKRATIKSCSDWSSNYRVMGQPFPGLWTTKYHPWSHDMLNCESEMIVGQKGAQLAFTEVALNKCFYAIDVKGISVLYILPANKPDASDFSSSRFDPALELSPRLADLFSDVKNIHHKRAGSANLFIRGSRSRSQLKSVPVGLIIGDEIDEMVQENIPLAFERMSGQIDRQAFLVSTPTIDDYGINFYYRQSSQQEWFFKCPHCSRQTRLVYPECLVITADSLTDPNIVNSHLICKECNHVLAHSDKPAWLSRDNAEWIPAHSDRLITGFNVSQLYSCTVRPSDIALSVFRAETNPADEQELYNSKLGRTHAVEGAKVTEEMINQCMGSHTKTHSAPEGSFCTLGIDVGKRLHYEVDQWFLDPKAGPTDLNLAAHCIVKYEGSCLHFEELDRLFMDYKIRACIIDANPERRKALEFAKRFEGIVKMCFYGTGVAGKNINVHPDDQYTITVDRTSWLDLSLGRFKRKAIVLPRDLSLEYRKHITTLTRVYKKNAQTGETSGHYVKPEHLPDHLAHARTYSEIALQFAAGLAGSHDISSVL